MIAMEAPIITINVRTPLTPFHMRLSHTSLLYKPVCTSR